MSKEKEIYLLSEYKINEKDKNMKLNITEVDNLEKNNHYYLAIYVLENLILQDGTSEKFNFRFLNLILDHYDEILKEIKNFSSSIVLDEPLQLKYEEALNNAGKYNFYYFRDCMDKYEVSLNQNQLAEITKKKKKHNLAIIQKFPFLEKDYSKLIEDIESKDKIVSAQTIYEKINILNLSIKDEHESKLFYIYKYLDINLIHKNKIFDLIQKDKFYLNQFSFGFFNNLGIPIGYSNNLNLKLRYLFLLLKNKINDLDAKKKKKKVIHQKKQILQYNFFLLFLYVIHEDKYNVEYVYNEKSVLPFSYFKILCEQFSTNNDINDYQKKQYESLKIIKSTEEEIIIDFNGEQVALNYKDYSINSFIINSTKYLYNIIIKNHSKKFMCRDQIYGEYFDDYIELLKTISCSNTVKIMQSLHEEFKSYKAFYSNDKIKNDFFENRLKFYPYECYKIHGITDKYLLEVYLSSIYSNNISNYDNNLDDNFKEILYIFNMAFNSVIFQHEALNHYIRAYLSYFGDELERKISIDTKTSHIYYPAQ